MKKQLKERTRNSWTMTESQFKSHIISALRQASRWWKPKIKVISRARVGKGKYKCELCHTIVNQTYPPAPWNKRRIKGIQADHIIPVVWPEGFVDYNTFIERLFVEEEGFQAICHTCHSKWKTIEENSYRREVANLTKELEWKNIWRLTVIRRLDLNQIECECDCWNITIKSLNNIKYWKSRSCWCLVWTHKMSTTRIYNIWKALNQRCNNPNTIGYKNYWWRSISGNKK